MNYFLAFTLIFFGCLDFTKAKVIIDKTAAVAKSVIVIVPPRDLIGYLLYIITIN